MTFVQVILALVRPILGRVLIALGFSVVTIVGVDVSMQTAKDWIVTNLQGMPANMAQLASLAGAGTALGMIFGAMTFAVTLWTIRQARSLLGTGGS